MWNRAHESCAVTQETAWTLLYAQETTTAQLWSQFCFPDCLVGLNKDSILLMVRKKDFAEIQNNFLTAGHSVFFKSLPISGTYGHIFLQPDIEINCWQLINYVQSIGHHVRIPRSSAKLVGGEGGQGGHNLLLPVTCCLLVFTKSFAWLFCCVVG